jgi:large subunit ribosomal protein L22
MSYSFEKYNPEKMAVAVGRSLPVSTKHCIELTGRIRRKTLESAKRILNDVIEMKKPIAFKRFNGGVGHKSGMAAGRYPIKAAAAVLKVVESCEANAQFKGLDTGNMLIIHSNASLGGKQYHYGRQRRRIMKRTMVEIVLEETGKATKESKDNKSGKKAKSANETKSTEKPAQTEKSESSVKSKKPSPIKSVETNETKSTEKPAQTEKLQIKKKINAQSDKSNIDDDKKTSTEEIR